MTCVKFSAEIAVESAALTAPLCCCGIGKGGTALQPVLDIWTERHGELTGVYAINISTVAIALLLALQHPQVIATEVLPTLLSDWILESTLATSSMRVSRPTMHDSVGRGGLLLPDHSY